MRAPYAMHDAALFVESMTGDQDQVTLCPLLRPRHRLLPHTRIITWTDNGIITSRKKREESVELLQLVVVVAGDDGGTEQ